MGLLNQLALENSDKPQSKKNALESVKETYRGNKRLVN